MYYGWNRQKSIEKCCCCYVLFSFKLRWDQRSLPLHPPPAETFTQPLQTTIFDRVPTTLNRIPLARLSVSIMRLLRYLAIAFHAWAYWMLSRLIQQDLIRILLVPVVILFVVNLVLMVQHLAALLRKE
jgi:hypothetical protein